MFQKITIIGRVGRDPEMRYTPSGKAVTTFNVAANRKHKDTNGQRVDETVWFRVTCWDKQAEIVSQYVKKGKMVHVEGRLEADPATGGPRLWTRTDGSTGASFEVTARDVTFLDSGGDREGNEPQQQSFGGTPDDDEFPF